MAQDALHIAISNGCLKAAEHAIQNGADPSLPLSESGWTPLHGAVSGGFLDIVDLLVSKKADVNAATSLKKNQAIHLAAKEGNTSMVEKVLLCGADVEAKNKEKKRAIHYACENGCLNVVKLLVDRGADPLTPDSNKCSPFDYATIAGDSGSQENGDMLRFLQDLKVNKTAGGVMKVPQGSIMFEGIVTQVGENVNKPGTWWWDHEKKCVVEGPRPAGSTHPNLGRA